jgi:hypothetical protein
MWGYQLVCYVLITVVPDDEFDINALDGFAKGMYGLYPKLEGEDS